MGQSLSKIKELENCGFLITLKAVTTVEIMQGKYLGQGRETESEVLREEQQLLKSKGTTEAGGTLSSVTFQEWKWV